MTPIAEPADTRRWVVALVLVLIAHGGIVSVLSGHAPTPPVPVGEPAVLIDMEPNPVPEVVKQPEPSPPEFSTPEFSTPELAQERPPDPAPPPVEGPLPQPAPPPEPPAPVPPLPDPPPIPEAAKPPVVIPPPARTVQRPRPQPAVRPKRAEEPRLATDSPATPPPTTAAAASAPVSWQARLLAHLNRFKRYPPDAQMHRRQGTAVVHLRLLPNGSVEAVRLQSTSGTVSLDQEAVELIGRAQPLPVPDAETGATEFAVPIQFIR